MSEESVKNGLEYSRQLQEKFELYLLGLIFTLLGLAIQTAKFGGSEVSDCLELFGWLSLLISGIVGLSRLEWLPVAHSDHARLIGLKSEHRSFIAAAEQGIERLPVLDQQELMPVQTLVQDRANAIGILKTKVNAIEKSTLRKYSIHKWSFVLGLTLLVFARGYTPAVTIIKQHLTNASSSLPSVVRPVNR